MKLRLHTAIFAFATLLLQVVCQQRPPVKLIFGIPAKFSGVTLVNDYVLVLNGTGAIEVKYLSSDKKEVHPITSCYSVTTKVCVLESTQGSIKSPPVDIQVGCINKENCDIKIQLMEANDYVFTPKTDGWLMMDLPMTESEFTFKVNMIGMADTSSKIAPKIRMESIVQSDESLYSMPGFNGKKSLYSMSVYKNNAGPSINKMKGHDIKNKASSLGTHLLLTIPSDLKEDYCVDDSCTYFVTVKAINNPHVSFNVKMIPSLQEFTLNTTQYGYAIHSIEDQTEANLNNHYLFNIPKQGDLQFELSPGEGNPDIYVNIDDPLNFDYTRYRFKSDRNLGESLIITKAELDTLGIKGDKVYVAIRSNTSSTYILSAEMRAADTKDFGIRPARLNAFYSGNLNDKEVVNYVVDYNPEIPEVVSAFVNLKVNLGNPDLYIKDCDQPDCQFTYEEIQKKRKEIEEKIKKDIHEEKDKSIPYFAYSENVNGDDNIHVTLNMVPYGSSNYSDYSGTDLPTFSNPFKTSINNRLCIGIVGHSNSLSKLSGYTLLVSGKSTHAILSEYKTHVMLLNQNDESYFLYSPRNVPKEALGLEVKLEVAYGDAICYYSASVKYPSEKFYDEMINVDNSQTSVETRVHSWVIPSNKMNSETVYFGCKASKESRVRIMITFKMPEAKGGEPTLLIPNVPIYRKIVSQSSKEFKKSHHVYTFKFFSNEEANHEVFVKLNLISGMSRICAAPKVVNETPDPAKCTVSAPGDTLIIPHKETDESHISWNVFVIPLLPNSKEYKLMKHELVYSIQLIGTSKVSEIKNSGVPVTASVKTKEGNLHYFDFVLTENKKYAYVHIESETELPINIDASFTHNRMDLSSFVGMHSHYSFNYGKVKTLLFDLTKEDIKNACGASPSTMPTEPLTRLLQSSKDGNLPDYKPLPGMKYKSSCRMYIRVNTLSYTDSTVTRYKLWLAMDDDVLAIKRGEVYNLPYPYKKPLVVRAPVSALPHGLVIGASNLIHKVKMSAKLVSQKMNSQEQPYSSYNFFRSGYGSLSLQIAADQFDHDKIGSEDSSSYVEISITRESFLDKEVDANSTQPIDAENYLSLYIQSDIGHLKLNKGIYSTVQEAQFQYYILEADNTDNITVFLRTYGEKDADIYVQKGYELPSQESNFKSSYNYKSDEIFLPAVDAKDGKIEKVVYTIGVYGITQNTKYMLEALSNSWKVMSPPLGEFVSVGITKASPLIIRLNYGFDFGSTTRVMYYSPDASIKVILLEEDPEGVLQSISKSLGEGSYSETNEEVGVVKTIVFDSKIKTDPTKNKLLMFTPSVSNSAVVYAATLFEFFPLKISSNINSLKLRMAKDQQISLQYGDDDTDFEKMTVLVKGSKKYYELDYDHQKYNLASQVFKGGFSNYTFEDRDLKDTEKHLVVTFKAKAATILQVSNSEKHGYEKAILGETHKTLFPSSDQEKGYQKEYYLEVPHDSTINNLYLEIVHPVDAKIIYSLVIGEGTSGRDTKDMKNVPLLRSTWTKYGRTVGGVKADLPVHKSTYRLFITANIKEETPLTIRFSSNNMQEIEPDGVLRGTLLKGKYQDIELMTTHPGTQNIIFVNCKHTASLDASKGKYIGQSKDSQPRTVFNQDTDELNKLYKVTFDNFDPTVLYLRITPRSTLPTEYLLITKSGDYDEEALANRSISIKPALRAYTDYAMRSVRVEVPVPQVSTYEIKEAYPNADSVTFELVMYLYMGIKGPIANQTELIEKMKYCGNPPKNSKIYISTWNYTVKLNKIQDTPANVTLDFGFSEEMKADINKDNFIFFMASRAETVLKATIHIFESSDFSPVGSLIRFGPTTEFKAENIQINEEEAGLSYWETTFGKILIVLIMLFVMATVLIIAFFMANKLAANRHLKYKKVGAGAGVKLQIPEGVNSLEMSDINASAGN